MEPESDTFLFFFSSSGGLLLQGIEITHSRAHKIAESPPADIVAPNRVGQNVDFMQQLASQIHLADVRSLSRKTLS